MKTKVVTLDNKPAGDISLNKEIFGLEVRKDLLHRAVNWQLAKRQAGTHKTKPISEVSGTSAKPFRQKGTGGARQGSKRSPHMRGGSVIFGPVVRSHAHDLPKKIRKLALKTALSAKMKEGKVIVIKDAKLKNPKTSELVKALKSFDSKSFLLVDGNEVDEALRKACSNLANFNVLPSIGANVYDILRHESLFVTESAIKNLEERLA